MLPPAQGHLTNEGVNIEEVVQKTTEIFRALSIDIPRIAVVPAGEVHCYYQDFDLDLSSVNLQPVSADILVQHLHDQRLRYTLHTGDGIIEEKRPEDYIVRGLIDFDDVDYDRHAETLYRLAGQVVEHLQKYLDANGVLNVLQFHQKTLVELVHAQMQAHFVLTASSYEAYVTQGFKTLKANSYAILEFLFLKDFGRKSVQCFLAGFKNASSRLKSLIRILSAVLPLFWKTTNRYSSGSNPHAGILPSLTRMPHNTNRISSWKKRIVNISANPSGRIRWSRTKCRPKLGLR